jgi:hypothetical protein
MDPHPHPLPGRERERTEGTRENVPGPAARRRRPHAVRHVGRHLPPPAPGARQRGRHPLLDGRLRESQREAGDHARAGPRPAGVAAVRGLARAGRRRRSRQVLSLRRPGLAGGQAAPPGHDRAGHPVADRGRAAGGADGRAQRGSPGHDAGLRAPRDQPGRALHAVVLARHGDHPRAGGVAPVDPADDLRLANREPAAPRRAVPPAGPGRRLPLLRAHHAHHALRAPRGPPGGLRPHGLGEGPASSPS